MSSTDATISSAVIEEITRRVLAELIGESARLDDRSIPDPQKVHWSPEAKAIKREIVQVGRKLWQRSYVDGNGGNISARISDDYIVCTPTLLSKADLTEDDLCLVDMHNRQKVGHRPQTSEMLLHLEIYKANPKARAVVHCHPPHATAYAIAGIVPPAGYIPEFEVFVGQVALTPYETPGTKAFAESVLPYVKHHNTILLANHGVVCWSGTVTHAEWCVEVLDTYCQTLAVARQLGTPLRPIPERKLLDLLRVKRRLGLPDPRLAMLQDDEPEELRSAMTADDFDDLVRAIADQVSQTLDIG
jgi:L-fuculose-phosphate aldolase